MKLLYLFVVLFIAANSAVASTVHQNLVQLAEANDDFGFQLLHRLEVAERAKRETTNSEPTNLFISQFSISSVLAMLMAGGANETYQEIRNTLGFDANLTEREIYTSYSNLLQRLQTLTSASSHKNKLQVANAMALQVKFPLLQTYLDVVSTNFDSKIFPVDFATKAVEATEEINNWVANKTNGKIPKLFQKPLDRDTRMVLLNAIYFKDNWKHPFNESDTKTKEFKYGANKRVNVTTMHKYGSDFNFATFDDGDLLELPYEGNRLSMLLFLPNEEKAKQHQSISSQFAQVLSQASTKINSRLAKLSDTTVNVFLPRFNIKSSFKLKSTLQQMGIKSAFNETKVDFSRITEKNQNRDLCLAEVWHKTVLEVNEEGSIAAAVTAGELFVLTSSFVQPRNVHFNRPFLFVIRDNTNQLNLFAGVVNKP